MLTVRKIMAGLLVPAFLAMLFLPGGKASALQVEVEVPTAENATRIDRAEVLEQGFAKAVAISALEMLPGPIAPEREELLAGFLASRAGSYVLSYSDLGSEEGMQSRKVFLDVSVNRQALKETLKRLGVYYTTSQFESFDLKLSGGASAYWEELGRLTELSGLDVHSGTMPSLGLSLGENGTIIGRLSTGENEWSAASQDIEGLWLDIWGRYFTGPGAGQAAFREFSLKIDGWYATDGVRAFDRELASWDREVESAELRSMRMLAEGLSATWRLRTMDRSMLSERLAAYLPDRGLSFSLKDVGRTDESPEDVEAGPEGD